MASLISSARKRGAGIVTDNLAMHIDAASASSYSGSGTTFSDLTANGYDWTITGATFTGTAGGGSSGEYFLFDGTGDWFDLASAHSGSILRKIGRSDTIFSMEFWVYFTSAAQQIVLDAIYAGTDKGIQFNVGASSNKVMSRMYPGAIDLVGTTNYNLNAWNQIGVSGQYDNSTTCNIWLNGVSDATGTVNSLFTSGDSSYAPRIGAVPGGNNIGLANGTRFSIGRLYDADIGLAGFAQNYEANRGRFSI